MSRALRTPSPPRAPRHCPGAPHRGPPPPPPRALTQERARQILRSGKTYTNDRDRVVRFADGDKFEMPTEQDLFITPTCNVITKDGRVPVFVPQGDTDYVFCTTVPDTYTATNILTHIEHILGYQQGACSVYAMDTQQELREIPTDEQDTRTHISESLLTIFVYS
jgi:hypothetical protein